MSFASETIAGERHINPLATGTEIIKVPSFDKYALSGSLIKSDRGRARAPWKRGSPRGKDR